MDTRRLSTMDVISAGIMNLPPPDTDIPEGREEVEVGTWRDIPLKKKPMLKALEDYIEAGAPYGLSGEGLLRWIRAGQPTIN